MVLGYQIGKKLPMFKNTQNDPSVLAIRFANTRVAIAIGPLSGLLGALRVEAIQTQLRLSELEAANVTVELCQELAGALFAKASTAAKEADRVKDLAKKAHARVYQPLVDIDQALHRLSGLLEMLNKNKCDRASLWLAVENLPEQVATLEASLASAKRRALAENERKLLSAPLYVWGTLFLLSAAYFLWALIAGGSPWMFRNPTSAMLDLTIAGILVGLGGTFGFGILTMLHVDNALSPEPGVGNDSVAKAD